MEASLHLRERFTRAYEEYAGGIRRFCMQQGAEPADAEEFVQEAFLRTWEYLSSGKEVIHLKTFLFQVAQHVMFDEARRRQRKKELSLDALQEAGFTLIFKEVVYDDAGKPKGNCDADKERCSILLKRTGAKIAYINDQRSHLELVQKEKAPDGDKTP